MNVCNAIVMGMALVVSGAVLAVPPVRGQIGGLNPGVGANRTQEMEEASSPSESAVRVLARGVGLNEMAALKDAFRDAVERAVGLYVDAEQMMRNEELIKDEILTHSNAYILSYDVLSNPGFAFQAEVWFDQCEAEGKRPLQRAGC